MAVKVAKELEDRGSLVVGALPRWVRAEWGWSFAPVWRFPVDEMPSLTWGEASLRVVPGSFRGMEELSGRLQPQTVITRNLWFVRVWDPLYETDWKVETEPREPDAWDEEVAAALDTANGGWELTPVRDGAGRKGLLALRPFAELGLVEARAATLRAVGEVETSELSSIAIFAQMGRAWEVQFWEATPPEDPDLRMWERC